MQQVGSRQQAGPTEQIVRPQDSILKKSGTLSHNTVNGTGAAQGNGGNSGPTRDGNEVSSANGAPASRQLGFGQVTAAPPAQENRETGFQHRINNGPGPRTGRVYGDEGVGPVRARKENMDGPTFSFRDSFRPPGSFQRPDSFQRSGSLGRVYSTPSLNRGSFFDSRNISMGPGMAGSLYGTDLGSMGPGMVGSLYGPGFGSMGPGMVGNLYGPGFGSMGPGMVGNLYGTGFGSMGPGMVGSLYGAGFGSMYDGPGITAQWASLNNMSRGSMYGGGSMYRTSSCHDIYLMFPNISTTEGHVKLKRSGQRGGSRPEPEAKKEKGAVISADTTATPLLVRKVSFSKSDESKTTAKVPANYNVHSLILVDKEGDAAKKTRISVKDPRTLLFKRDDGKDETFENDECIVRDDMSASVKSVLLVDLQDHWIAGHTSALLVGGATDRGEASVTFAKQFLNQCLEKVEKNKKEKLVDFDVSVTLGVVESTDRIRDLLDPDNAKYEKMQLGSSPVFGPCLCGMKYKTVKSAKECEDVFNEALARTDEKKQLVVGFFVLKQIKKSSGEKDIYLSSLCIALAREEISHLNVLREKGKTDVCTLFRYAIGGASVTVTALLMSDGDPESRGCLELGRKMREIKNDPPRSGNLKRCVETTKKEIGRQKDKMDKMGDTERKSTERIVAHMETMVRDSEEMLSNPDGTEPKRYPMGGRR